MEKVFERRVADKAAGKKAMEDLLDASKEFFKNMGDVDMGEKDAAEKRQRGAEGPEEEEKELAYKGEAIGEDEEIEESYDYIISLSHRGKKATLHRKEGCWRSKRLAFGSFELVGGQEVPPVSHYDMKCKNCWRNVPVVSEEVEDLAESSSSDSSSSSSRPGDD